MFSDLIRRYAVPRNILVKQRDFIRHVIRKFGQLLFINPLKYAVAMA